MYETFVSTYKEANPNTEITELDLFALDLPYYGNIAISGGYKRSQGMELTAEEEGSCYSRSIFKSVFRS